MHSANEYRTIPRLDDLCSENHQRRLSSVMFAFRVFDDDSQTVYDEDVGFIAGKFLNGDSIGDPPQEPYDSVAGHVDGAEEASPWISASRQWAWAIWEMSRRERARKTNIRLAVIDIISLRREFGSSKNWLSRVYQNRIVHALQFLDPSKLPREKLRRLQGFANIADEVLFYGSIPADAVVSVVRLEDVASHIPGYEFNWVEVRRFGEATGFRAAHNYTCDRLAQLEWDPDSYALECVALALAMLRPAYGRLERLVWSLFFDIISKSEAESRPIADGTKPESNASDHSDPTNDAVELISHLSIQDTRHPPRRTTYTMSSQAHALEEFTRLIESFSIVEIPGSRVPSCSSLTISSAEPLYQDAAPTASHKAASRGNTCVSRRCRDMLGDLFLPRLFASLLGLQNALEDKSWSLNYNQAIEPFEHWSTAADAETWIEQIHITAEQITDERSIIFSNNFRHQVDSARQKIEYFKGRFSELADTVLLSHIDAMDCDDWEIFRLRVKSVLESKIMWLEQVLQLLEEADQWGRCFSAS